MNIPDYNIFANFADILPESNDSSSSVYDYLYDSTEKTFNNTVSNTGGSQHLATILQQLFSKMSDNQTTYNIPSSSSLSSLSTRILPSSSLSRASSLPVLSNDTNSYQVLSIISLWFVLIVNAIVILFGVIGNLLASYILINGNIVKLPVSFYTIMLNISDTLNLLIPVLIFWLDNCINRTPERGYFRDRSNFLCKALMCPDQLFAALSAWYMCAISFNRWCSVCRPSWFFSNTKLKLSTSISNKDNIKQNNFLCRSFTSLSFCFPFDYCFCLNRNTKYRQHLQAFRCIGIITLVGILCCLYPIFMHELRAVISTNQHFFDLKEKITHTYAVVWKRCYYSRRHEYAYDIIGIILSSFLHILPLTSVAAMNIMIIVRLKQRQRLMSNSTITKSSTILDHTKKIPLKNLRTRITHKVHSSFHREIRQTNIIKTTSEPPLITTTTTHRDQETLTDSLFNSIKSKTSQVSERLSKTKPRRHQSRDRNITIMLVSVALSYLILTLPYRLFWSYNVYIKRMYPEKLNSPIYLLKMHYIDHVLRTIRNIHYGTNFIFFIFLSKPFRRKFRQLFMEKFLHSSQHLVERNTNTWMKNNIKTDYLEDFSIKLPEMNENNPYVKMSQNNQIITKEYSTKNSHNETSSLVDDARMQEDGLYSIIELEQDD